MGPVDHSLHLRADTTVLMLCGLQGSGKTTTCGKLGRMINERGRTVDARRGRLAAPRRHRAVARHRRAARHPGLQRAGRHRSGRRSARTPCARPGGENIGVVILDTAGRLHIDEELMQQLERIDHRVEPRPGLPGRRRA